MSSSSLTACPSGTWIGLQLSLVPGRGIEAVAFTPQELRTAYEKGDPRVVELERYAVFLSGERALKALLERD
jgi:hypothetical protein